MEAKIATNKYIDFSLDYVKRLEQASIPGNICFTGNVSSAANFDVQNQISSTSSTEFGLITRTQKKLSNWV